jgi:predicted small lipoprotein YifL
MMGKSTVKGSVLGLFFIVLALGPALAGCGKKAPAANVSAAVPAISAAEVPAAEAVEEKVSSSSVDWEKALKDYEEFVDDYIAFMKKYTADPTDFSLLTQYGSMLEKAQKMSESLEKIQGDISAQDLAKFMERYASLAAKMAQALQ